LLPGRVHNASASQSICGPDDNPTIVTGTIGVFGGGSVKIELKIESKIQSTIESISGINNNNHDEN